ncbi:hypothetical protein B9Z55_010885 [Caenorhabditis nigoni]|uniref:Uncharacterized protein n=1 Tax=Caenorhabditis nigoni TaxID=1611254 RepID=A0A2G5UIP5_9PELO|nr:hypothetical protein B9Z55_010885 [Caenorhabditis nigoni]
MSFLAIPMPFSRNTSPVVDASTSTPECSTNDPNCDLMRYLVALVVFVGLIALFMFGCKAVMRLFTRKRNTNTAQTDTDVIYPSDERRATRSHQNFGFMDPPPRYEQIFKRGGGAPSVITTREAPSVTRSSGDASLPPSYEQAAINARRESQLQSVIVSQPGFREVPLTAIDMEHPAMPSPSSTILDMESEIANIQNHAHACVTRYDSNHANGFDDKIMSEKTFSERFHQKSVLLIRLRSILRGF